MSAWLCSEEHLSAIVNSVGGGLPEFKMLLAENLRSLAARYGEGTDRDVSETYMLLTRVAVSPTQVVKCCDSYDYQSSETNDYDTTTAAAFVNKARAAAIAAGGKSGGPEYDRAEWRL